MTISSLSAWERLLTGEPAATVRDNKLTQMFEIFSCGLTFKTFTSVPPSVCLSSRSSYIWLARIAMYFEPNSFISICLIAILLFSLGLRVYNYLA